jgi:predicted MFS family arabinose efflux permease
MVRSFKNSCIVDRMEQNPTAGQSAARAWVTVGSITIGAFAGVTTEFIPVGLLKNIGSDLGVNEGVAGLMVMVPALTAAVSAPLVMLAAGRLDRRVLVLSLSSLLIASNVLAAASPTFSTMLLARVMLGINVGGFWAVGPGLGVRLAPGVANVGRATAAILAGISLGTVFGVPAGTAIGNALGWRAAFVTTACLAIVVLVAQAIVLPSLPPEKPVRARQMLALLQSPSARVGLLAAVTLIAGHFMAYTYVTAYLRDVTAINPAVVSIVLLGFGVAGLAGNFVAGAAVERSLRATLICTVGLLTTGILLLPIAGQHSVVAVVAVVIWGFAFSGVPLSLQVWMFKSSPDAPEGGSVLFVSIFQLCLALGALLGGFAVDGLSLTSAMWIGGGVAAITLLTAGLTSRVPGKTGDLPPSPLPLLKHQ